DAGMAADPRRRRHAGAAGRLAAFCQLPHSLFRPGDLPMMAVIFEVQPAPGQRQAYLDTAAALRPQLERMDGFLSIERFQSLSDPDRLLSLSFWRDEAALAAWRRLESHRRAQAA